MCDSFLNICGHSTRQSQNSRIYCARTRTHLLCPYTTPRILLSDNRATFRTAILAEICYQYNITQTFAVASHPTSNGLVETANSEILDALRPVVKSLFKHWEDWIHNISACKNYSVSVSTRKTPYYILYKVDKKLPYDFSVATKAYEERPLLVFSYIHIQVCNELQASMVQMIVKQHRNKKKTYQYTRKTP